MTVAVTGATGHVGGNLVRALLDAGRTVRVLVYQDGAALQGLDVERVEGNVLDPESLRGAFDGVETVYHLAAVITLDHDPRGIARKVNVEGTRNVIDACRECGVKRLIHFSSIHALSPHPRDQPVDESRPLSLQAGVPAYDLSKAEAERLVLEAVDEGFDARILCPTGVIGPNDFEVSRMGQVVLDFLHRRTPACLRAGFNWVDVRDVVSAALAVESHGAPGERYLISGNYHTFREVAAMVEEVAGVVAPRREVPFWVVRAFVPFSEWKGRLLRREPVLGKATIHALMNHQIVDCSKARKVLGYEPRPMRESIADTVAWFKQAGHF